VIIEDKRILAVVAGAIILAAGSGYLVARWTSDTPPATEQIEEEEAAHSDTLTLTNQQVADAGIAVEAVRSGGFGAEVVAQGMVTPTPSGEALVTARTGGTVTRVYKRLGDAVRAGEPLAIVESRDAAQIASERSAARARATLAQRNLEREKYLFDQKVSARVELETAEAEAAAAAAEARRAEAAASAVRITGDGRGSTVTSPISGRVTATTIALGSFVQPEVELFRIADPRQVQVEASVGPADMARFRAGDRAAIDLPDGSLAEGRVRSVTPTLGAETRAATVVIDIAGADSSPASACVSGSFRASARRAARSWCPKTRCNRSTGAMWCSCALRRASAPRRSRSAGAAPAAPKSSPASSRARSSRRRTHSCSRPKWPRAPAKRSTEP